MKIKNNCSFVIVIATAFFLIACQEDTIEGIEDGVISGRVIDFESTSPIAGAGITTTPPSSAIVTDSAGGFRLENLEPSNYSITARKFGYQNTTVSVAVGPSQTTEVVIQLEKKN